MTGPGATKESRAASAGPTTAAWTICARLYGAFCPDEADVEARCLITFSLRVGEHLIVADNGPRDRADVLAAVRDRMLS